MQVIELVLLDFNLFRPEVKHMAACLSETEKPLEGPPLCPSSDTCISVHRFHLTLLIRKGLGDSHEVWGEFASAVDA